MFLAQEHNAVTLVMLEPATPQSRDKHSTTKPLHRVLTVKLFLHPTLIEQGLYSMCAYKMDDNIFFKKKTFKALIGLDVINH